MTTVACDGQTVAADTMQVGSYIDPVAFQKIHRVGRTIIGVAGDIAQCSVFIRWFKDQSKPKPSPENMKDFEAMVVRDDTAYYYDELLELVETGLPCAIGSGSKFAMAAMLAGADAVKAVKIAMKLDIRTGGKVRTIKIK